MILITNFPAEAAMQTVEDSKVNRTLHVWRRLPRGKGWRCVLCGGISFHPTDDCTPVHYECLEADDRRLCPQEKGLPILLEGGLTPPSQGRKTDLGLEKLEDK